MIYAGYPAEMDVFMTLNPGFKHRIRSIFHFEDFPCQGLAHIFIQKVATRGLKTDVSVEEFTNMIEQTSTAFGKEWNARFCDRLLKLAKEPWMDRYCQTLKVKLLMIATSLICEEDIQKAIDLFPKKFSSNNTMILDCSLGDLLVHTSDQHLTDKSGTLAGQHLCFCTCQFTMSDIHVHRQSAQPPSAST